MSDLGTIENPYTHAPDDWGENGVPYAAYCRCHICDLVTTSTFTFDYFADEPGDPLVCEHCTMGSPMTDTALEQWEGVAKQIKEEVPDRE